MLLSHVPVFATPWTVAHPAPLSAGFSRQEYWSGLPFLSPGDHPESGIKPTSPELAGFTAEPAGKPQHDIKYLKFTVELEWWSSTLHPEAASLPRPPQITVISRKTCSSGGGGAFPAAQLVRNPPALRETLV